MRRIYRYPLLLITLFSLSIHHTQATTPIQNPNTIVQDIIGTKGMVSSQHYLASQEGLKILKKGGNAIDAAVCMGFVLAVTLPRAGNIGGGGFMLIHIASENRTIAIDYREIAPQKSSKDMFLNKYGQSDDIKSRYSIFSSGIPGTVYGLTEALNQYGTLSLKEILKPAIHYAKKGFVITPELAHSLQKAHPRLSKHKATSAIFYPSNKDFYAPGDKLVQKDLAWSLQQLARHGRKAFYDGPITERILDYSQKNNGLFNKTDFKSYKSVTRKPVVGTYKDFTVVTMPPPSSGGIVLIQLLNIAEQFPLKKWGYPSAKTMHVMIEAMKLGYADRAHFLGDPDFVNMPTSVLISKNYARQRRLQIDLSKAESVNTIHHGKIPKSQYDTTSTIVKPNKESSETTHFSVIDKDGNCVSNTYTLNFSYGNGQVVPGTGILLNNEMDDFSSKPGHANAYGLIGSTANAISGHKRMLSSMTPTIVFKDNHPFLITGSPGGSRIITTVYQMIIQIIDFDRTISEATYAPRFHHQWKPDRIYLERGQSKDTMRLLQEKGHSIVISRAYGGTQSILIKNKVLYGASDPRKPDSLTVGY